MTKKLNGNQQAARRIAKFIDAVVILALVFCFAATTAHCQGITPTALESKGPKMHGTIMVSNPTTGILNVRVEAQSFDFKEGAPYIDAAMDNRIHVTSKQHEFTLGPQQEKYIDFTAQCDSLPCHFYVTPVFSSPAVANGFSFARWMPVAVYMCDKAKACRHDTLLAAGVIQK